jgi:hypothetical protein
MLFNLKSSIPEIKSRMPFMNEPTATIDYISTKPSTTYDNLDFWIERTSEAIAIINAICTDIQADGFSFEGGKQNVNRATRFCQLNNFNDEFFKVLWDWIKYGDAYLWIGGVRARLNAQNKIKERLGIDIDIDEDTPRDIKYVPANTMNLIHDGKKIIKFLQSVSGQDDLEFPVEDIIHAALLPNKGKVYGFSPSWASLSEMSIIGYLKDYAGNFFKNGGVPDWMFVLPNELAGSPNHRKLIEVLQKYKHPQRKHGNLVFTGEVNATQLGNNLDQVDITNNAIYFASVLALAHNMPVSRVAVLIGAKVRVSTGGDDLANEGYWSKIARHQDSWETWLNTQLFEPFFNVKIRFNRAWKINEIKEQQRNQFAINNIKMLNSILSMRYGKQLKLETIKKWLYLRDSDLEEGKPVQEIGGLKPPQLDNLAIRRGAATEAYRAEKRKQVSETQDTSGIKALQVKTKLTHIVNKELFFEKFERWVKQSTTRNCYYNIKNGVVTALISTPDDNFKLVISESELDETQLNELKEFGEETEGIDV